MAAPTPFSAYLHSATMVKAGLFLMARLWPVLAGTEAWFYIVATTGLVTMVIAAWIALFKDDLKGLRSEEHTSELQSLMRISYAVFCLKKKNKNTYIDKTLDTKYTQHKVHERLTSTQEHR